jgi:hypothetical protein
VFGDSPPAIPGRTDVCRAPEPAPLQRTAHPSNRSAHRTPTRLWAGHESRGAP